MEQFTSRRTRAAGAEAEADKAEAAKEEEEEEGGGWWVVDDGVQCMTRARLRQKVLGQTSHLMGRGTRGLGFSFQRF